MDRWGPLDSTPFLLRPQLRIIQLVSTQPLISPTLQQKTRQAISVRGATALPYMDTHPLLSLYILNLTRPPAFRTLRQILLLATTVLAPTTLPPKTGTHPLLSLYLLVSTRPLIMRTLKQDILQATSVVGVIALPNTRTRPPPIPLLCTLPALLLLFLLLLPETLLVGHSSRARWKTRQLIGLPHWRLVHHRLRQHPVVLLMLPHRKNHLL